MSFVQEPWFHWLIAGAASSVVLVAGGILTEIGPWYFSLAKPRWQPADRVFPIAWTIIYVLVTWATVVVWDREPSTTDWVLLINAFVLNGMLNVAWSLIFFKLRRPDGALLEVVPLWLSTLLLLVAFYSISPFAGLLVVPYLLWVSVAAYLNLCIVRLNPSFASWQEFPSPMPRTGLETE